MKTTFLWANRAIGAMDAITGLLLMFAPSLTLRLMRLPDLASESMVYLSWIGAFVFAIGMSYLFVGPHSHEERVKLLWQFTAFARAVIAVFVTAQVLCGNLSAGWLTVAATDASVAMLQCWALSRSKWKR